MPAANSVASELVKPPVVVISMLYQDIARLPLYQHRAIKPRHTQAPVRHNYERYLFCVDLGDYRIISWHGFFVYVILWLVFINPSRLSPPGVVPPRLTALLFGMTGPRP